MGTQHGRWWTYRAHQGTLSSPHIDTRHDTAWTPRHDQTGRADRRGREDTGTIFCSVDWMEDTHSLFHGSPSSVPVAVGVWMYGCMDVWRQHGKQGRDRTQHWRRDSLRRVDVIGARHRRVYLMGVIYGMEKTVLSCILEDVKV